MTIISYKIKKKKIIYLIIYSSNGEWNKQIYMCVATHTYMYIYGEKSNKLAFSLYIHTHMHMHNWVIYKPKNINVNHRYSNSV